MRIYDYLDEILRALNAEESSGVPTPSWRIEEYLKDIYDAIRSGIYPSDEQVAEAIDAWLDDHPEATTTVQDGSITNAKLASSFVTPGTAAAYSSSATYAVGDYVFYGGDLYRCTTPITTAETWTAAHWTAAVLGDDVGDLKTALKESTGNAVITGWVDGKFVSTNGSTYNPNGAIVNANFRYVFVDCSEGDVFTINGAGGGNPRLWAFADASNNVLEPKAGNDATATNLVITAPANATRLIINDKNKNKDSYYGELLVDIVKEVSTNTDKNTNEIEKLQPLTFVTFVEECNKVPGGNYYATGTSLLVKGNRYAIKLTNTSNADIELSGITIGTRDTAISQVMTIDSNVTVPANGVYISPTFVSPTDGIKTIKTGNTANATCTVLTCSAKDAKALNDSAYELSRPNNILTKYSDRMDILAQLTGAKCFLIYTDIHGSSTNLDRMSEWYSQNQPDNIEDIICLGDMVNDQFSDSIAFLDNPFGNATLKVIGNHDVLVGSTVPGVTSKQAYDKYIAPNVSSWGVTQPTDASTDGKNYYYKDYDDVRLIVLDTYFYTTAQNTWFSNILDDALTNNKTVIVAEHEDICTSGEKQPFNSDYPFARKHNGYDGLQYRTVGDGGDYTTKRNLVDSFIENGGKFACWLCGHQHTDMSGYYNGTNGKQASFLFNCAAISGALGNVRIDNYSQDCFTYFAIDTTNSYIYVCRIGQAVDKWGHKNEYLVYDYANGTVVEYH